MIFQLPELPFKPKDLAPKISEETIQFHYEKHHKTYVEHVNQLVKGTMFEDMELEESVMRSSGEIFNNAGQAWNHTFYWNCLSGVEQEIGSTLLSIIQDNFGSAEYFKDEFLKAATHLFGSGWTWLVRDAGDKLTIVSTSNAGCPIRQGLRPILTCDLWEHAYYIDYRND